MSDSNPFTVAWSRLHELREALEELPQTPALTMALGHHIRIAEELRRAEEASQVTARVGRDDYMN